MIFFMKPTKIVVDCFTHNPVAFDLFPIKKSNECIPDWWKKVEKNPITDNSNKNLPWIKSNTVRRCSGIIDYYNNQSFNVLLWSDVNLEYSRTGSRYIFADGVSRIEYQEEFMRGDYLNDFHQFKIISPWKFKEKSGIKFHYSQSFYNFNNPDKLFLPPGIIDYKYQHTTEINFFVKKPEGESYHDRLELEAGMPMAHITPITEKKIELKHHLIDFNEFHNRFERTFFSFNSRYSKRKKILDKKHKGCPFHKR